MADTPTTIEALRIVGGTGTGKTQLLVKRTNELLASQKPTGNVLVLCATPQAGLFFSNRLSQKTKGGEPTVTVTTPRAAALEILGTVEAREWSGRDPRLLTSFEKSFLLEDMKVSGLRPKRLREMLKFFYRSWTELADDNPNWLLPDEEESVHALLKANLTFMRGILEPEAANLAVHYLRSHPDALESCRYSHVVVDDYQCLSKASQTLANLLAKHSIAIAGDYAANVEAYDSYPYAAGLDEFAALHTNLLSEELNVCHRSYASASAARALLNDAGGKPVSFSPHPGATPGEPNVLSSSTPADEFDLIARTLTQAVSDGIPPASLAVAVPNSMWAHKIIAALRNAGLQAESPSVTHVIRGDIRDNDLCLPARILTALGLMADPHNATAWRCWCGYGDHLANSAAFAALRSYANEQGLDLTSALNKAAEENETGETVSLAVGAQRVIEAYRLGLSLIEQVRTLSGENLLQEITRRVTSINTQSKANESAPIPSIIRTLCSPQGQDSHPDAAAMLRRALTRLNAPVLENPEAIAVVPYSHMTGFSPRMLLVSGFVNGFIPSRDYFDNAVTPFDKQEKMHVADTQLLYSIVGKAENALTISYFTTTDLETAERLKLQINRIYLEKGTRMCRISPSEFLAQIAP